MYHNGAGNISEPKGKLPYYWIKFRHSALAYDRSEAEPSLDNFGTCHTTLAPLATANSIYDLLLLTCTHKRLLSNMPCTMFPLPKSAQPPLLPPDQRSMNTITTLSWGKEK